MGEPATVDCRLVVVSSDRRSLKHRDSESESDSHLDADSSAVGIPLGEHVPDLFVASLSSDINRAIRKQTNISFSAGWSEIEIEL